MKATDFVEVNPKKMSGTPVFRGTRVPIQNLFDCLEDGETLEQFLEQFPTVANRSGACWNCPRKGCSIVELLRGNLSGHEVHAPASHI